MRQNIPQQKCSFNNTIIAKLKIVKKSELLIQINPFKYFIVYRIACKAKKHFFTLLFVCVRH